VRAGCEAIRGEKAEHADHSIIEAGPDRIAAAGASSPHQRRAHPERGVETGDEVADRRAGTQRRAIGLAGDAHEATHCLGDEIERRTVAIGPAVAEAGDVTADEVGVQRLDPRLVKAHPGEDPRTGILDQHIAAGDQLGQCLAALFVPQVERQRAFVAVEPGEIPAEPVADQTLPAHRVAVAGRFDLDHLGAHVAEQHGAERPGEDAGQIDHAQSR